MYEPQQPLMHNKRTDHTSDNNFFKMYSDTFELTVNINMLNARKNFSTSFPLSSS